MALYHIVTQKHYELRSNWNIEERNKKYLNTVNKYKSQLTNGFTLLKVKKKAKTAEDLLPDDVKVELPKFARVNKLLTNKESVLSELKSKGYKLRTFESTSGT